MAYVQGTLVISGRVLSRSGKPRFRYGDFVFEEHAYDEANQIMREPETVRAIMSGPWDADADPNLFGFFRVVLYPSSNGVGWVSKLILTDVDGNTFVDRRIMPPEGEVDYFACAPAVDLDDVVWPVRETPLLVSDFNKPGGPLQLTDQGTISDEHIPGNFLRVGDERMPDLQNYLTTQGYETDQLSRNSVQIQFPSSVKWVYDHGKSYRPLVMCVQSDGTELFGAVTYPVGTTKVQVEWDAPTSGLLIVR